MSDLDPITNYDDIIDSRDVLERIEYLTNLTEDSDRTEDEELELTALTELAKQGSDASEAWTYGVILIRHSYFQDYAQELADDISDSGLSHDWPYNCIDWEQAARDLSYDYSSVEFEGVYYYVR